MYRYVRKRRWVRHCFVSTEKGSAIKTEENEKRNLNPEMSKTVKGNHRINEINQF